MQYWKDRPQALFTGFAKLNQDETVETYPVPVMKVVAMLPGVDLNDVIIKPPVDYVPVFRMTDPPFNDNALMEVVMKDPVRNTEGYWMEAWEVVPLSIEATDALLAEVRAMKNAEINASRLAANNHFFPFKDKEISCDPLSRSDIDGVNGMVNLNNGFPDGWIGGWKCRDNTYIPVTTIEQWKELYKAMFDQGQINFAHSQLLKSKLGSVASYDELMAINWSTDTGLPATPLPERV